MEEPEHGGQGGPAPSSSYATTSTDGPSSSSPSTSQLQEEEVAVENERLENGDNLHHHHYHHHHVLLNRHQQWRQQQPSNFPYHLNILISDVASTEMKETLWSYLVLLVTFWFLGQFHPHSRFPFFRKEKFPLLFCSVLLFFFFLFELLIFSYTRRTGK